MDSESTQEQLVRLWKEAGTVIPFRPRPHLPTVTIHGRKYVLSNHWSALQGLKEELHGSGPRIIQGPNADRYSYLWAYDTERQIVEMWRVSDGESKTSGNARQMAQELYKLDKLGQLNRVTTNELHDIERAMAAQNRKALESMQAYIRENESAYQKTVNKAALHVFDRDFRPKMERRIEDVRDGVFPLGFSYRPQLEQHGYTREKQAIQFIISQTLGEYNEQAVERELRKMGLDPDDPRHDSQAIYWAVGDVRDGVGEETRTGERFRF